MSKDIHQDIVILRYNFKLRAAQNEAKLEKEKIRAEKEKIAAEEKAAEEETKGGRRKRRAKSSC